MFFVRSVRPADLGAVLTVARHLDSYNLPADRAALKKLIRDSVLSFSGRLAPDNRRYLFVAEDMKTKRIVGTSLILARHGTPRLPHLAFQVGHEVKKSASLQKRVRHQTLTLRKDTRGFTEIGGLAVLPRFRRSKEKIGKQLSYARFAYMAAHPQLFRPRVLVEYIPEVDHETGNKLWTYLGQNFTDLSYHVADRLSAHNKEFILSLFPKEKIYTCVLPYSAQRMIGALAPGAEASLHLLKRVGFRFLNQVDPFDGGPHYAAALRGISLVRQTRRMRLAATVPAELPPWKTALILVEKKGEVRAVASCVGWTPHGAVLPETPARILGSRPGNTLSVTEGF